MDIVPFLKKGKCNSHSVWYQRIILWWIELSLLDKILFYLFLASFFVIVIPSLLNDFFYASIYFTDFSVGFPIILLFVCIFWVGYFSRYTANNELRKTKVLESPKRMQKKEDPKKPKKLQVCEKFTASVKKNRISSTSFSLGLKNTLLSTTGLSRVLYIVGDFFLLREMSAKLILCLGTFYHSKKSIKIENNDIKFSTKINDMPATLPLPSRDKTKKRSYSLIIKKFKAEKKPEFSEKFSSIED